MNKEFSQKPKKTKMPYVLAILFLVPIFCIAFAGAYLKNAIYSPNSANTKEVKFTIVKGEGSAQISKNLKEKGLIKNDFIFLFYLKFKDKASMLQAGDYLLNQSYSMIDVMQVLTKGKVITDRITIPEGWTNKMIEVELVKRRITTKSDFKIATEKKYDYDFLNEAPEGQIQGFLFPDTYQLSSRPSAEEVVTKMLQEFSKKIDPKIRAGLSSQTLSYYDVVILASIVEREVSNKEDRRLVAGIFLNRLEIDMPLQSDATLQYILNSDKRIFSIEETRVSSPYNTYANKGVTPTPIANPGVDSIEAVLSPTESNYLYFLSGKDGTTYFSETLEEHERKKALYL